MPKKKKGGKKKVGKKKSKEPEKPTKLYEEFNRDEMDLISMLEKKMDWVHVELRLVNWQWANFTTVVRTSTPLTNIQRKIEERHGRITDLRLYRNPPSEKNEIKQSDWVTTLDKLGITGGPKEDNIKAIFYFDFTPARSDALLLIEPKLMIPDKPRAEVADDEDDNTVEATEPTEEPTGP